ncbi:hypothetical protein BC834DRAFT_642102 [Gloeopeniophorella convolvens]|nr:hypothetical protein BC834DRAFT_642102 [Gloeopeniophorella convolvens]
MLDRRTLDTRPHRAAAGFRAVQRLRDVTGHTARRGAAQERARTGGLARQQACEDGLRAGGEGQLDAAPHARAPFRHPLARAVPQGQVVMRHARYTSPPLRSPLPAVIHAPGRFVVIYPLFSLIATHLCAISQHFAFLSCICTPCLLHRQRASISCSFLCLFFYPSSTRPSYLFTPCPVSCTLHILHYRLAARTHCVTTTSHRATCCISVSPPLPHHTPLRLCPRALSRSLFFYWRCSPPWPPPLFLVCCCSALCWLSGVCTNLIVCWMNPLSLIGDGMRAVVASLQGPQSVVSISQPLLLRTVET